MTALDRPKTLKLGQDALRYNVDSQLLTTSDSDTHRRLFSGLAVWPVGDDARTFRTSVFCPLHVIGANLYVTVLNCYHHF